MLVAGLVAAIRKCSRVIFLRFMGAVGIIGAGWAVSAWPAIGFACMHGRPTSLGSTQTASLSLWQLVSPGAVRSLAKLPDGPENAQFLHFAERGTAYLGVVTTVGCALLAYSLMRRGNHQKHIRALAVLSGASLLLGMSGALAAFARVFPMPKTDASSLPSVYVAYTALAALALVSTRWLEQKMKRLPERLLATAAIACITLIGLWDQRVVLNVNYDELRSRSGEWRHAIKAIEHAFPAKSSVFQLPNVLLPEAQPTGRLEVSAQLLPYFNSQLLRFSYGSFGDRRQGEFMRALGALPADQIADRLIFAGFSGVFVANKGYPDRGEQIRGALSAQLGRPILLLHKDIAVYSLLARKTKLVSELGQPEFERRRAELASEPYWGWLEGCYPSEYGATAHQVRCESKSRFVIDNPMPTPVHVVIEAKMQVAPVSTRVRFSGDLFHRELGIEHSARDLSEGFDVPPGEHFVTVNVDGIAVEERNNREIAIVFEEPHFAGIVR